MQEPEYKLYQRLYQDLVKDHSDDFSKMDWVTSPELVDNALSYFRKAEFPIIYPAKSYAVAIIYAKMIEQYYGIALRDSLNDTDLFLGHDEFFVPYNQDPETYEAILERLKGIPDWLQSGWAPKTVEYFYLECTAEGLESING